MSVKTFALTVAFALAGVTSATAPANAAILENGDFVGAKDGNGVPMPAVYGFASHSDLTNFAWTNSGSGALDWIAQTGSQVITHAPANPIGYTGNVYVADASNLYNYNAGTYLMQELTGLVANQTYVLTFLQAAGSYYEAAETVHWDVGFGGTVTYGATNWELNGASHQSSADMLIDPATGTSAWTKQTMTFTATGASELLSFFATGTGAPPFALLANVSVAAVPEPATWAMMILGLGLVGFSLRRAQTKAARTPIAA